MSLYKAHMTVEEVEDGLRFRAWISNGRGTRPAWTMERYTLRVETDRGTSILELGPANEPRVWTVTYRGRPELVQAYLLAPIGTDLHVIAETGPLLIG